MVTDQEQQIMLVGASGLMAAFTWHKSLSQLRRMRLITDLPTVTTAGVYVGVVEVSGKIALMTEIRGHLSGRSGAWMSWSIQEEWRRTETETDSKGNTKTKTTTGWSTRGSGHASVRFLVRDAQGSVAVEPEGAEITATTTIDWQVDRSDPRYWQFGPADELSDSTGHRRITEYMLLPDSPLWLLGHARITTAGDDVEIAADANFPDYVMSVQGEAAARSAAFWSYGSASACAFALAGGCGWVAAEQRGLWVGLIIMVGLLVMGWLVVVTNSLIALRQRVLQALANIEVELQRRADLIPSLVAALQGLQGHEREVQTLIATLRSQAQATLPGQPGPDPQAVRVLVERYPDLVASASTARLMAELTRTEDRIALARGFASEVGVALNTRLESIPDGWIARLAGCRPVPLFQADGFTRRVPVVALV